MTSAARKRRWQPPRRAASGWAILTCPGTRDAEPGIKKPLFKPPRQCDLFVDVEQHTLNALFQVEQKLA